jgi:hypothetical protein
VDLARIDEERLAWLVGDRRPALVVERQLAGLHLHEERARMGMPAFAAANGDFHQHERGLKVGHIRQVVLQKHRALHGWLLGNGQCLRCQGGPGDDDDGSDE